MIVFYDLRLDRGLNRAGENIMGWYGDYIIPAGALLVGLFASSGFGIASWMSGCKITGTLLKIVVGMLLGGYLAAHYIEYQLIIADGKYEPVGFLTYFDLVTRAFAWKDHDKLGSPH